MAKNKSKAVEGTGSETSGKKSKGAKKETSAAGDVSAAEPGPSGRNVQGRNYTTSLAVAGSCVSCVAAGQPSAAAAAAAIASQIARAALAGCVDEVVVYEDDPAVGGVSAATAFLAQALQYLETPPYLRSALCPLLPAPVLSGCAALAPLSAPHHLGQDEWAAFREGVVLKSTPGAGSFVDAGLDRMVYVNEKLPLRARVTLAMGAAPAPRFVPEYSETMLTAEVVSPITPRVAHGTYWGFSVRLASSLHDAIKGGSYKGGYDLMIGTSAKGIERGHAELTLPRFSHLLLAFGGASKGLAEIMEGVEGLDSKGPEDVFNMYLNVCPGQGNASVRTEDVVLLALGYLRPAIMQYGGINVGGAAAVAPAAATPSAAE